MKIPADTPVEVSMGVWRLFGVGELSDRPTLPLDADGMELLRRHREAAERDPRPEWHSRFRIGRSGRTIVVFVTTTWWREPREKSLGFLGPTVRFVPMLATGPGLLTLMCLEDEWEELLGERPDKKLWPRDN